MASALALAKQGYGVTLVDPHHNQPILGAPYDLKTVALTPASMRLFERIDVASKFDHTRLAAFIGMQVWDGDGEGSIDFTAAALNRDCLGTIIEDSNLGRALHLAVSNNPLISRRHAFVAAIELTDRDVHLEFDEGSEALRTRLVLGCDGAQSPVRSILGIKAQSVEYSQHAVVCNVDVERGHGLVARQRFLRNGPIAFLPLPDADQCAVVWSTSPEEAAAAANATITEFEQMLRSAFANTLGAVTLCSERAVVPLQKLHASKYVDGRAILLGDAAHVVHPLAGQGLNLGLMDAAALAQCLDKPEAINLEFPGAALRQFERMRRGENLAILSMTDQLNRLFRDSRPLVKLIRSSGMLGVNQFWPVKHWLMLRAMGDVGDVPDLAARR